MMTRFGVLIAIVLLILIRSIREDAIKSWRNLNKRTKITIAAVELSGALGVLAVIYAIKLAPVSLVTVIGGLQAAFVFALAIMLSFKFPKILKEELNKKIIIQKSIAIILMIMGLMFL